MSFCHFCSKTSTSNRPCLPSKCRPVVCLSTELASGWSDFVYFNYNNVLGEWAGNPSNIPGTLQHEFSLGHVTRHDSAKIVAVLPQGCGGGRWCPGGGGSKGRGDGCMLNDLSPTSSAEGQQNAPSPRKPAFSLRCCTAYSFTDPQQLSF